MLAFGELPWATQDRVTAAGRCTIGDGKEFACVVDMPDSETAAVSCDYLASDDDIGQEVICYVDGIGLIAGSVRDLTESGFMIGVEVNAERHARIEARLTWMREHVRGLADRRVGARIVPKHRRTTVKWPDGRLIDAEIADLSMSGAGLVLAEKPSVGAVVTVGKRFATVIRHKEDGIGVAFRLPFSAETFNEQVVL
ncbi:PilZ domain-containing protein [Methylobacterium brachythecii]|uniref:PilZ domain-containing protein n=1 Tax=Methylobacterium brachythecii TaxID=1176177 RepID=A0A7W6AFQ0_9HYPH|nr:PilZ domain-containing protein [Methylobacterium brachythecii]MBB3902455.1 hypothetical protein [Methylobacterium brachythecii]GLS42303.1 hypothetical protein GCM10007884_02880 [Methylobacterium brachythecii]